MTYAACTNTYGQAQVWSVRQNRRVVAYLKCHRHRGAAEQEARALCTWGAALGDSVPSLLHRDAQGGCTLWIAPLQGSHPNPPAQPQDHLDAGRWLRRLHALPLADPDPMPLPEALARRLHAWKHRAAKRLPADMLDAIATRAARATVEASRRPCHRDFTPQNWLISSNPRHFGVCDFGHARADHPLLDLVKLASDVWPTAPECRRAFAEGYGLALDSSASDMLHAWVDVYRVGTWLWATDHGDSAEARRAVDQLRSTGHVV